MMAPPGSLELHQQFVNGIRKSTLCNQFVAEVEQSMEHQPIF